MSQEDEYELVLTPPARRALTERLPEVVAAAVIEFLPTALVRQPQRVSKPLRGELAGVWAARRGTYRVLYRLRETRAKSSWYASNTARMSTARIDDRGSHEDRARSPIGIRNVEDSMTWAANFNTPADLREAALTKEAMTARRRLCSQLTTGFLRSAAA